MRCSTSKKEDVMHEIVSMTLGGTLAIWVGLKLLRKKLNDLSYQGIKA